MGALELGATTIQGQGMGEMTENSGVLYHGVDQYRFEDSDPVTADAAVGVGGDSAGDSG